MADFLLRSTSSTERANSTAYALGDRVVIARADAQASFATMRKYTYECTAAGTSGATVPVYPTTPAGTVTDGTVVWTCREAQTWVNAGRYADYLTANRMLAGDRLFISQAHVESIAATLTITSPGTATSPCYFLCVDDSIGGDSPTTLSTGASITTTLNTTLNLGGSVVGYGISFSCGTGTSGSTLQILTANGHIQRWKSCDFILAPSNGGSYRLNYSGGGGTASELYMEECRFRTGAANAVMAIGGFVKISGGSLMSGGNPPTAFFSSVGSANGQLQVNNFDFFNCAATFSLFSGGSYSSRPSDAVFNNCRMPTSWSGGVFSSIVTTPSARVAAYNLDAGDTNYSIWREGYSGSEKHDTSLYLSGSDGIKLNGSLVPLCYKLTAFAAAKEALPLDGVWRAMVNEVTTAQTATLEIIHNETASLNNDEIWLEVEYPATAGSTQFTRLSDSKADILATGIAQTASTADWDDGLTARANSFTYAAGAIVKSASSLGSAFICTIGGASASSEPAGYTSAADGSSITDGTATFYAMRRQKLEVPFTAAEQGVIRFRPMLAKASAVVWTASKVSVA